MGINLVRSGGVSVPLRFKYNNKIFTDFNLIPCRIKNGKVMTGPRQSCQTDTVPNMNFPSGAEIIKDRASIYAYISNKIEIAWYGLHTRYFVTDDLGLETTTSEVAYNFKQGITKCGVDINTGIMCLADGSKTLPVNIGGSSGTSLGSGLVSFTFNFCFLELPNDASSETALLLYLLDAGVWCDILIIKNKNIYLKEKVDFGSTEKLTHVFGPLELNKFYNISLYFFKNDNDSYGNTSTRICKVYINGENRLDKTETLNHSATGGLWDIINGIHIGADISKMTNSWDQSPANSKVLVSDYIFNSLEMSQAEVKKFIAFTDIVGKTSDEVIK